MKKLFRNLLPVLFLLVATVFYADAQAPTITSFSPVSGPVGTTVTITGTGFDATPANNIVFFGATMATVAAATVTSLMVTVPVGATYQPITELNGTTHLIAYSATPFITTYTPNKGAINTTDIAAKIDFTTGANPYNIAIGDLDGDGKPDLVVANYGSNTISVFRNTSTGGSITAASFAAKVDFTTGNGPFGIAIGDLDGDGKPDLAVTNGGIGSASLSVFRNTSTAGSITTASFAAKVDFATGTSPLGVAIGDLDGDGKPDIVVANGVSYTVSVFRNTSTAGSITTASFAAKVDFATGNRPEDVTIGDLDGDGKPDLVVANAFSNSVSVFRNTSTGSITPGSFAAKVDFNTGVNPYNIAIGDLDGDGKPDLVMANSLDNTVSVLRNTSTTGSITTASFAAKVDFATGSGPGVVAIGDLDGDGKLDIAVANSGNNTVSVFRNTSTGGSITTASFTAKVDFPTGVGSAPPGVAIGDLNGDGRPDLATANSGSNTASVFRNSPLGITLTPAINSTPILTALSTTAGTASASTGFNVSGLNMAAGILVSPPPGFEVSIDNIIFGTTVTIGAAGTIAATPVYIRLAAADAAGTYAGNVVLTSSGAVSVNVATIGSTVNPVLLTPTITFNALIKTYGDTDFDPAATSDNSGTAITYSSDNTAIATIVNGKVHIVAAGTANITASQPADATHFAATNVTRQLMVNKAAITITATAKSKTYGDADPQLTYTITAGSLVGSDAFTGSLARVAGENVGTYAINQNTLALSVNYALTYIGAGLVINKATLTITADNQSRSFGIANLPFTASYTGFVNGETPGSLTTPAALTTIATMYTAPGNYAITAGGASSLNYTFNYVNGTLTINPIAIKAGNILSPNGDGKNDTWVITGIQQYPNNKVTVFDRAGRVLYLKTAYNNDWDGTLNGRPLAQGTYFYIIELGQGMPVMKGFISIVR